MKDTREFIRKVLQGERSRRIPRALFGAGLWAYQQTAELDTDIVFAGSGLNTFPAEAIGGELAFSKNKAPLLKFPLIQKTEDMLYLEKVKIEESPHTLALIEMIAHLRKSLPDRFLCATSWGPFTWAMILCDWNLVQEKTATDKAFIHEVCELGIRLSSAFYGELIDRGLIDGISIPDGAVTLTPLDLYREVILPAERKLFEEVKERGIFCFLHQCGNISSQVGLYPETGAHCVTVDVGVPISEVYELYQQKLVTAGNVDVINAIFGGKPEEICGAVSACVSGITDPYRNYILMPSCDLPPDTPLRNVKEFLSCPDR
jgi:uroporphyrinogen decarboxylase